MGAALPDLVILGPGLIDGRHDPVKDSRVLTDIDQFRYVLGFVIERLQEEAHATVVWAHFDPPPHDVLKGGLVRGHDLARFAAVGRQVAEERGVYATDSPYARIAPRGVPQAALVVETLAGIVHQAASLPVGGLT